MGEWERYTNKHGQKDVRAKGARGGEIYEPKAYAQAKARAVKAEVRARDLADAKRLFVQTAIEKAAKAGPSEASASDRAKSEVERLLRRR